MVRFDNSESQHEEEIEHLTQEITGAFRSAERGLQRMGKQGDQSAADAKTRQNVQRALATQLQALSGDFRKSQKDYLGKVKGQKDSGPVEFDFLSDTKSANGRRSMDMVGILDTNSIVNSCVAQS